MIDIKKLRDNSELVKQALKKRGYDLDVSLFSQLDSSRKSLQIDVENLQAERKKLSAEFGKLKSTGDSTDELKKIIDSINEELSSKDMELQEIMSQIDSLMLDMPNIPDNSVPEGKDENSNVEIEKHLGIVQGSTVRARNFGSDMLANLKSVVGGELVSYSKLLSTSREQAYERMIQDAKSKGADAVIGFRYQTSTVAAGASEILAYGTGVKIKKE